MSPFRSWAIALAVTFVLAAPSAALLPDSLAPFPASFAVQGPATARVTVYLGNRAITRSQRMLGVEVLTFEDGSAFHWEGTLPSGDASAGTWAASGPRRAALSYAAEMIDAVEQYMVDQLVAAGAPIGADAVATLTHRGTSVKFSKRFDTVRGKERFRLVVTRPVNGRQKVFLVAVSTTSFRGPRQ